jgi:nitrite reductase/ring-hydroxylating ferredoxin subunit
MADHPDNPELEAMANRIDRGIGDVASLEPGDTNGWCAGPKVDEVTAEKPVAFEGGRAKILVLRVKDEFRAFRNACAHVGLPLERGMCDVGAGTITCPWHGFRFDSNTGECLSAPQCQLEPFPLRVTAGAIWVKPS